MVFLSFFESFEKKKFDFYCRILKENEEKFHMCDDIGLLID